MTLELSRENVLQPPCRLDQMLHDSVQRAAGRAMLAANQIQFDVPDDLLIHRKADQVKKVLHRLMDQVLLVSRFCQIRVTVKTYSDVVLIHIRDAHGLDEETLRPAILETKPLVEELGGFLDITSHRPTETTLAFSFLNLSPSATDRLN